MTKHAETRIDRLSGGQKKRVNIGMELLTKPTLLFLDEPTSPLDPHLKRDMFTQMRKMADKDAAAGQSVIVITHDVESKLIDQCDRLIVLQPGGKMAYFGPPGRRAALLRPGGLGGRLPGVRRRAGARLRRRVPELARVREVRRHPDLRPPAAARRGAAGGRGGGPAQAAQQPQPGVHDGPPVPPGHAGRPGLHRHHHYHADPARRPGQGHADTARPRQRGRPAGGPTSTRSRC